MTWQRGRNHPPSSWPRSMGKPTKKKGASKPKANLAVREWSNTPSVNPRYKGATPAELGRALLRKPSREKAD